MRKDIVKHISINSWTDKRYGTTGTSGCIQIMKGLKREQMAANKSKPKFCAKAEDVILSSLNLYKSEINKNMNTNLSDGQ